MKNKEIEELLNKLEYASECDDFIIEIRKDRAKLLLSYIEQLEEEIHKKEAMYDSLAVDYRLSQEQNEQLETDYKEANESVTWWTNRFSAVERDNRNLKNNRDKAIEYINNNSHYYSTDRGEEGFVIDTETEEEFCNTLENILKGDSDE